MIRKFLLAIRTKWILHVKSLHKLGERALLTRPTFPHLKWINVFPLSISYIIAQLKGISLVWGFFGWFVVFFLACLFCLLSLQLTLKWWIFSYVLHVPMQIFPLSFTLFLVAYTSFHFIWLLCKLYITTTNTPFLCVTSQKYFHYIDSQRPYETGILTFIQSDPLQFALFQLKRPHNSVLPKGMRDWFFSQAKWIGIFSSLHFV